MSSEMRAHTTAELLALYDANGGDWCKIARAVEERFLARTEAGADHGAADHGMDRATKESLVPCDCGCGRSCCAFCGTDIGFVTHPQDASGDAEDAAMFRWLCDNARPWESDYEEPHALIRICRGEFQGGVGWFNIIGRESRVGIITLRDAVRCAMQAKEAK